MLIAEDPFPLSVRPSSALRLCLGSKIPNTEAVKSRASPYSLGACATQCANDSLSIWARYDALRVNVDRGLISNVSVGRAALNYVVHDASM